MFQRYIVRIIFMVPVYSLTSFACLLAEDASIYIITIRDCYEAWIIYNFMSLCLEYVGGPGAVEVKMQGVVLLPSWTAGTCCLPAMPVNGQFIRKVKRGALQFVILKPILAILTVVLYATGNYTEGNWSPGGSFLWITIVYNITYTVALYALLLFYLGTHDLLVPFRPLLKFIVVKAVIFLTFWQGLFVSIAVGTGAISTPEEGAALQNFLIACEMLPAAVCILFAFPWQDFVDQSTSALPDDSGRSGRRFDPTAVGHAISIRDVVTDTVHHFAPTYQDYVLYSDGTTKNIGVRGASLPVTDASDLLSSASVEMSGNSGWNKKNSAKSTGLADDSVKNSSKDDLLIEEGGIPIVKSRYLASEADEKQVSGSQRKSAGIGPLARGADAETRWQNISLSPPK